MSSGRDAPGGRVLDTGDGIPDASSSQGQMGATAPNKADEPEGHASSGSAGESTPGGAFQAEERCTFTNGQFRCGRPASVDDRCSRHLLPGKGPLLYVCLRCREWKRNCTCAESSEHPVEESADQALGAIQGMLLDECRGFIRSLRDNLPAGDMWLETGAQKLAERILRQPSVPPTATRALQEVHKTRERIANIIWDHHTEKPFRHKCLAAADDILAAIPVSATEAEPVAWIHRLEVDAVREAWPGSYKAWVIRETNDKVNSLPIYDTHPPGETDDE